MPRRNPQDPRGQHLQRRYERRDCGGAHRQEGRRVRGPSRKAVSIDRRELFETLARLQPGAEGTTTGNGAEISVPALVAAWLERGPAVFAADDRARLDTLYRQIDVRKKVSAAYGAECKRLDPETPAEPAVVSGLVAVLLANAAQHDGWGL